MPGLDTGFDNDSVRMQIMTEGDLPNASMPRVHRCAGRAAAAAEVEAAARLRGRRACHQRLRDDRARTGSIQGKPLYSDDAALRRPHYVYESCFVTVVPVPWASSALSLGWAPPPHTAVCFCPGSLLLS